MSSKWVIRLLRRVSSPTCRPKLQQLSNNRSLVLRTINRQPLSNNHRHSLHRPRLNSHPLPNPNLKLSRPILTQNSRGKRLRSLNNSQNWRRKERKRKRTLQNQWLPQRPSQSKHNLLSQSSIRESSEKSRKRWLARFENLMSKKYLPLTISIQVPSFAKLRTHMPASLSPKSFAWNARKSNSNSRQTFRLQSLHPLNNRQSLCLLPRARMRHSRPVRHVCKRKEQLCSRSVSRREKKSLTITIRMLAELLWTQLAIVSMPKWSRWTRPFPNKSGSHPVHPLKLSLNLPPHNPSQQARNQPALASISTTSMGLTSYDCAQNMHYPS